jgi:two-component system, NarL family, invasion response regulator UvrY
VKDVARGNAAFLLHEKLSQRELQVFQLLGAGKTVGEIARKLRLSVKTVSTHRARILEKTGLKNNAGIIRYAILNHLI